MNLIILFGFILILAKSVKFFRLSTNSEKGDFSTFTTADYLTSTLGNFQIRLIAQTCQLRV